MTTIDEPTQLASASVQDAIGHFAHGAPDRRRFPGSDAMSRAAATGWAGWTHQPPDAGQADSFGVARDEHRQ